MDIRQQMQKRALDRAVDTVEKLRKRPGVVGRAVRALDDELSLGYLAARLRLEDELIDRYVAGKPRSSELVSILVPIFGIPLAYLEELVGSVTKQTYGNWEICFCDDGDTTPNVASYLKKLAIRSSKFKMANHPTNLGTATATKTALGLAAGSLIAFVDEDDLIHPRALEAVVAAFADNDEVELAYTDNDHATDLGHRRAPVRKPGWSPELLQCVNYVNHLVVARRSLLDRCPELFAPSTSGGQDWDVALFAAERARRVAHVPLPLYHWRKRPGSIAAALGAKPWVRDACFRVRTQHLRRVDPRLTLSTADNRDEHRHHLEPDLAHYCEPPSITILVLDAPSRTTYRRYLTDYGGWQRARHAVTEARHTNRDLVALVMDALSDLETDYVFIVDARRPMPEGSLSRLMAFAIQPRVGCVWPFLNPDQRLCYTVAGEGALAQLKDRKTVFSRFSGNVLSGPLHGLLTNRNVLLAANEQVSALEPISFLEAPGNQDAVGATLGLAARNAGYRNVSCRGMLCNVGLADVTVPSSLLPTRDPYT